MPRARRRGAEIKPARRNRGGEATRSLARAGKSSINEVSRVKPQVGAPEVYRGYKREDCRETEAAG